MRWNETQDKVKPAIPFLFAYDVAGAQSVVSAGMYYTWDTLKVHSSNFIAYASNNRITLDINSSGFFKVTFECSFITYDNDDDLTITSRIYKNGSKVAGSEVITSVTGGESQDDDIKNSITLTYILYLEKDDYIQIYGVSDANTAYTIANTSRLIIEFIPMLGWDNGSAGRGDNKKVLR